MGETFRKVGMAYMVKGADGINKGNGEVRMEASGIGLDFTIGEMLILVLLLLE